MIAALLNMKAIAEHRESEKARVTAEVLAEHEEQMAALKAIREKAADQFDADYNKALERLAELRNNVKTEEVNAAKREKAHKAHKAALAKAQYPVSIDEDDPRLERLRVLDHWHTCGLNDETSYLVTLCGHPALVLRHVNAETDSISKKVHVFFETPDAAREFARDALPVFNV